MWDIPPCFYRLPENKLAEAV